MGCAHGASFRLCGGLRVASSDLPRAGAAGLLLAPPAAAEGARGAGARSLYIGAAGPVPALSCGGKLVRNARKSLWMLEIDYFWWVLDCAPGRVLPARRNGDLPIRGTPPLASS